MLTFLKVLASSPAPSIFIVFWDFVLVHLVGLGNAVARVAVLDGVSVASPFRQGLGSEVWK